MQECVRISPAKAAAIIGCRVHLVRLQMASGAWDLGEVVKYPNKRNEYFIFKPKLERFIGRKLDDMEVDNGRD